MSGLRITLLSLLAICTIACGNSEPLEADRIYIRLSGWRGVDIEVNRWGEGRFRISEGNIRNGAFSLAPQQFDRLVERLDPFRREAVPFTEESALEFIERRCPPGLPTVTDQGAVWIRWIGPRTDQHYLADLECDPGRQAARNRELRNIVKTLPVPLGW